MIWLKYVIEMVNSLERAMGGESDKQGYGSIAESESENEIKFLGVSHNYCICYVDMIGSTDIAVRIPQGRQLNAYYGIFLNSIAAIARKFGAVVVKNAGDCLICYFPDTLDYTDGSAFENVFACCSEMIEDHDSINGKLYRNGLPPVNYRLSADYGKVEVAISKSSGSDLFGSTMNLCAKINTKAPANGLAIGRDLYDLVMSFPFSKNYHFQQVAELFVGSKHPYLLYSVGKEKRNEKTTTAGSPRLPSSQPAPQTGRRNREELVEPLQACKQNGNRANIMLIDDDSDALLTIKSLLTFGGYTVEVFENPDEALNHYAQANPAHYDLVITDIRMPRLNGLQLYLSLKTINQNIRVLFLSALEAAQEMLSVLPGVEANQIIRKPVTLKQLLRAVEQVLV